MEYIAPGKGLYDIFCFTANTFPKFLSPPHRGRVIWHCNSIAEASWKPRIDKCRLSRARSFRFCEKKNIMYRYLSVLSVRTCTYVHKLKTGT